MACDGQNIYFLVLYGKYLPAPALGCFQILSALNKMGGAALCSPMRGFCITNAFRVHREPSLRPGVLEADRPVPVQGGVPSCCPAALLLV